MSLDKHEAVPIDTHVRQIAVRDYEYLVKTKSLTNQSYKDLGNDQYKVNELVLGMHSFFKIVLFAVGTRNLFLW